MNTSTFFHDFLESSEVILEGSSDQKAIQALAVDPAGNRMVSGGVDGILKYWEFSGMNSSVPRPFRQFVPLEGHAINALSFNSTGGLVLCVSSDSKARIYDREGTSRALEETVKGDPYIRTPENTKGHTHMLTVGQFHPTEPNLFQTGSYDCTVRLWDLTAKRVGMDQNIPHTHCFKCTDARGLCGGRGMYVSSSCYSSDGHRVVAGCSDGSIQLFSDKIKAGKTQQVARTDHGEITDVLLMEAEHFLLSRATGGNVCKWDIRKFRNGEPVSVWRDDCLPCVRSNMAVVQEDPLCVITGTSSGHLATIPGCHTKHFPTREIIRTIFHPVLRQIFFTTSDGNIFILYNPSMSVRGALLFVNKLPAKQHIDDDKFATRQIDREVYTYEDLLTSGKYRENKLGEIKQVTAIPGSRVPKPIDSVFSALSNRGRIQTEMNTELNDIQRDLLAGGDADGLVSQAYKTTQPNPTLDYSTKFGAVDSLLSKRVYCPKCGLKICTCGYLAGTLKITPPAPPTGPTVSSKKPRND